MTVSVKYLAQGQYGVLDSNRGLWRWIFTSRREADINKFRAINDRNSNFLKGRKLENRLSKFGIAKRSSAIQNIPNLLELDMVAWFKEIAYAIRAARIAIDTNPDEYPHIVNAITARAPKSPRDEKIYDLDLENLD